MVKKELNEINNMNMCEINNYDRDEDILETM